ncbi:MAG: hypothetical protein NTV86_13305 [Planctomycetota bacterium]|nr:hypothetical protein [Planctomycetota bacterium]
MFYYMFTSLESHYDQGFGAIADAFADAAEALFNRFTVGPAPFHGHLPMMYLYRHAVELYLKSLIIILHKALAIPFDDAPSSSEPKILAKGKWKAIYHVHSIADLYAYFGSLLRQEEAALKRTARTDWSTMPDGLDEWIKTIEEFDSSSTFFRYPLTKEIANDRDKSSWQKATEEALLSGSGPDGKPSNAFVFVDENHQVVEGYLQHEDPLPRVTDALRRTTELLQGAHAGMRVELAGGL